MDSAVFVQDNWKLRPRLTFELGMRWDYEALPPADPNLTAASGTFVPYSQLNNNPSDKKNFGPRVGFSYDLYGQGKTILRGGYGVYFGRINNGELLNIRFNTGSPKSQYNTQWKVTTAGHPTLPNIVAGTGTAAAITHLKLPRRQPAQPRGSGVRPQLQQDLGKGTFFALSYLGSQGRELPNFLDVNLNPTQTLINVTVADIPTAAPPTPADRWVQAEPSSPTWASSTATATQHCLAPWLPISRPSAR